MEYKILEEPQASWLAAKVTEAMAEGWQLQGGVSVTLSESDDYRYLIFAQAMVRSIKEEKGNNARP